MNKETISLFLHRNPIDDDFLYLLNETGEENILYIEGAEGPRNFNFVIEIDLITAIGLDCKHVFIETKFGRYSFLKKGIDLLNESK